MHILRRPGLAATAPWLLALGLTFALYGRTLALPFFWDDVPVFDFALSRTLPQIWTDATGFPFYRPATFTFWKAWLALLPPAPIVPTHAAILLVHAASGGLVGHLTYQLLRPEPGQSEAAARWAGLAAVLLFAAYPTAAVPVSHAASMFHLSSMLVTLSAAAAAVAFVRRGQRRWLAAAAGLAAAAPFFQETGIVAGVVAAAAALSAGWPITKRQAWLVGLLPIVSALFLPVWIAVPKSREAYEWVGWPSVLSSLTLLLQGPSYPLQLLARPVMERTAWSDLAAVWAVVLPAALGVCAGLWRWRRRRALAFGLVWVGLAILPSTVALPFYYNITSLRLLYYAAPGTALLWAALFTALAERVRRPEARVAAAGALLLATAGPAAAFIQREIALHQYSLAPVRQLAAIARRYPAEHHLVANFPDWVAYSQAWYALGHEGVEIKSAYVTLAQLAFFNSGVWSRFEAAYVPRVQVAVDGHYAGPVDEHLPRDEASLARLAPNFDRIWLTTFAPEAIALTEAGTVSYGSPAPPAEYVASFDDQVYLVSAAYEMQLDAAAVTLVWHYAGPDPGATVFRHLLECDGTILGLGDGDPLGRMLPFGALAPGAQVRDVRAVPLEARPAGDCLYLEIGLFRPDGTRVDAFMPDGRPFENAVVAVH